ncbi:LOW QUALITY PROTEIN: hypothetical protein TorRG33x02_165090 [Trema orientale]|uniref:Uncharacterized protein n=1 Tax=Trema orientale TaxID=63057 RepID=A0A2P5EQA3_TREOI|nr:LOW QUALITY PROTEIN: hypothetical protein TorRG33x02_165090 [Trema orientale]
MKKTIFLEREKDFTFLAECQNIGVEKVKFHGFCMIMTVYGSSSYFFFLFFLIDKYFVLSKIFF